MKIITYPLCFVAACFAAIAYIAMYVTALVLKAVKRPFKLIWQALFPAKMEVNSKGDLYVVTEEDEEDLNNYYKGKIQANDDGIEWAGIRP